jgi:hypothetical protein
LHGSAAGTENEKQNAQKKGGFFHGYLRNFIREFKRKHSKIKRLISIKRDMEELWEADAVAILETWCL